jgi:sugar lactone lactonase YvrE
MPPSTPPAPSAEPRATLRAGSGEIGAVAFSPDGKALAYGGRGAPDKSEGVVLCDPATGKEHTRLKGHKQSVTCLAFADGGKTLASGGSDPTVLVWDVPTGKPRALPDGWPSGVGPPGRIACAALTADGKVLAVADQRLNLLDVTTGKVRAIFVWAKGVHEDAINSVAFSPDDRQLASASWDGTVKLWDVRQAKEPGDADEPLARLWGKKKWDERVAKLQFTLRGPVAIVWSVAYARDGKALAAGYEDGSVVLWDPATGKAGAKFRHPAAVKSVGFAPDGGAVAAGCEDGVVRVWDVASGQERAALKHGTEVAAVAFAPDGKTLASAGGSEVKLWDVTRFGPSPTRP